jgi:hypothetical protein
VIGLLMAVAIGAWLRRYIGPEIIASDDETVTVVTRRKQ